MGEEEIKYPDTITCLVTGGAGFIGSHVCEKLLTAGNRVISVDNFNDFYDPAYKRQNISEVIRTAEESGAGFFVSLEGDIRNPLALDAVFREHKPDIVMHLAACAGVRPSIADPLLYSSVNIAGTINMLECVKRYGVGRFIFASSSSVYGNNEKIPFSETDSVDRPISPYAATKKAGELLCHTYSHLYGVNIACLRFFTVYGPRQRPDLAIYKFTKLINEGRRVPFYGDGSTERDYTYIDDILDGIIRAADWTADGSGKYAVFNLGNSSTVSLAKMVSTIETALGKSAVLDYQPLWPGDAIRTYADISYAGKILGYAPKTGFEEGIRQFVRWYRGNRIR
jgi:UDP-glucuronate 4-epimerase